MASAHLTLEVDVEEVLDTLARIDTRMDAIHARLARIERRQEQLVAAVNANTINDTLTREALMADFTELLAAVAETTDVTESIASLLDANTTLLRQVLVDEGVEQSIIDNAVAALTAANEGSVDAVVRNTIADTEPEPEPTPEPEPEG